MENLLHTFELTKSVFDKQFYLALVSALSTAALAYYFYRKEVTYENRNIRNVGVLLLSFGSFLCIGVVLFTSVYAMRIQEVQVFTTHLETAKGKLPFKDVKRVYLHKDTQSSHLSRSIHVGESLLLVVEKRDGKVEVFSEEYYPVKEMAVKINEAMKG